MQNAWEFVSRITRAILSEMNAVLTAHQKRAKQFLQDIIQNLITK